MRKAEDILKELGFNKEAPESTQNAFLRHLQKAAKHCEKAEVIPVPSPRSTKKTIATPEAQLSFDFAQPHEVRKKKKSL